MPKTKISEFSATPANNTDIDSINIAEGCAPSGINDAIRELMAQLKDFQTGAVGDSFNGPVGTSTAAAGAFTTLSASSTVSGTGFSTYLASPPAIGGTAAAAGAFTTLAASGAVTLSGGTANGVAYLNGSKVVTSGSALTFDGTNLSVGGGTAVASTSGGGVTAGLFATRAALTAHQTATGVFQYTSNEAAIRVYGSSGVTGQLAFNLGAGGSADSEQMRLTSTGLGIGTSSPASKLTVYGGEVQWGASSSLGFLGYTGGFPLIGSLGALPLAFYTNGSEKMRLDSSGNLGIGTSSPSQKLHVVGNALVTPSGGWTTGGVATQYFGDIYGSIKYDYNTTNFLISSYGTFSIATNGTSPTTRLTVDSSGNLGLGVTPSAWGSGYRALQVGLYSGLAYEGGKTFVTTNAFHNGTNWIYANSDFASRYQQQGSAHSWYTAPSGTAGNAITFTQAMTLDASGNLIVGATSNSGNGERAYFDRRNATQNQPVLAWSDGQDNTGYLSIRSATEAGENGAAISADTALFFGRMISGTFTERARIDSSGNVLVGTTGTISGTNAAKQVVYNNTASQTCFQAVAGSSHTGVYALGAFSTVQSSSGSNVALVVQSGNGSTVNANNFFVYTNGNVTNTNNSYGAISDVKLKENIVDATPKLANLMQVKVRNYNLIGQTTKQLGVVAQELETVFPAMVDETADRDTEGNDLGTTTKSVKYSVFVPMLIKAIQELKAEFDAYKASHP